MKKDVFYSKIITTSQLDNISDYIIKYLDDKESDEILIEKRLYSKLEKVLK